MNGLNFPNTNPEAFNANAAHFDSATMERAATVSKINATQKSQIKWLSEKELLGEKEGQLSINQATSLVITDVLCDISQTLAIIADELKTIRKQLGDMTGRY